MAADKTETQLKNLLALRADKCVGALFRDMTFVITGTLSGMTRDEAHRKIRELGGEVSDSVSNKITHLVVGEKPGSKLEKAKKFGTITIWSEEEFKTRLGGDAKEAVPSASVKMLAKYVGYKD